jgi:uncharacterized glyoxalase superfamily protein PhnB
VPQLAAFGIVAADMGRSVGFYRLLGVEVDDAPAEPTHHEATLPNGVRLMWDTEDVIRSFEPHWRRAEGTTLALAFECGSPAEVDETYRRVVEAGFAGRKEPWDAFWGQRYAQVSDPDGTPVDLFAPLT